MRTLAELVDSLVPSRQVIALKCGDVADRFPCDCGAAKPSACPFTLSARRAVSDAVNEAGAIVNGDGLKALRASLPTSGSGAGK